METAGTTITRVTEWGKPIFIKAEEVGETIEFIYKQISTWSFTVYPGHREDVRVFKIVFSCKDGKWNKSEPIYGVIIPPSEETYEFD